MLIPLNGEIFRMSPACTFVVSAPIASSRRTSLGSEAGGAANQVSMVIDIARCGVCRGENSFDGTAVERLPAMIRHCVGSSCIKSSEIPCSPASSPRNLPVVSLLAGHDAHRFSFLAETLRRPPQRCVRGHIADNQ